MARHSNMGAVLAYLDRWVRGFNMTRPGREQSLGRDLAMTIIRGPEIGSQGGIMGRCAEGVTPDGTPWPENSDEPAGRGYASDKEKRYGWRETNRRTSQMLSQEALYGATRIEPDRVTLVYGNDVPPDASKAPSGYIDDKDRSVTDRQKAAWAHQQGRGFYGPGEGDAANVSAVAQANLNDYIVETNRSR